jgi:hypothetical protein
MITVGTLGLSVRQPHGSNPRPIQRINLRPLRRGVKKIGLFFREETASFKRSAFGRFRKNDSIFSLADAAGEFSLWFVSLFFVKKRNEQSTPGWETPNCFFEK